MTYGTKREEADHAIRLLFDSFAQLGMLPSVIDCEVLAGRASGRVRLLLKAEDARQLAQVLRDRAAA